MKNVKIISTFLLFFSLSITAVSAKTFSDVDETNSYSISINTLSDYGVLNGYADNTFQPDKEINRAEFLKIVLESIGTEIKDPKTNCFKDIPYKEWYAPYICTAKELKIINGYLDDTFKPDSKINKVEALKIIGESLKWDIKETAKSQTAFTDIEEKEWYAPYIKYAENKKLIPEQENIFSPNENITRGETAEILYRSIALKQIPLKIKTNQTKSETLQISPEITISAKWEDKKTDLDAHFLGKNEEIYFIHRLSNNQKILLNSSSSQNPLEEEMIIKELPKGENTYFLHYYSGKKTFASSKTTVEIYDKNGLAKIYAPPDSKGEIWEVFSINGKGEITEINKIETCEESELSTAICSRPLN